MSESRKYQGITDEITRGITEGRWPAGRKIPSARAISRHHKVSLMTANRALQVLRERGLIRTVDRSGSYVVGPRPVFPRVARWALCLRLTPEPWFAASLAASRSGFDSLAAHERFELDSESLAYGDDESADALRERVCRAVDAGAAGAFLFPSRVSDAAARQDETFLAACDAASLPVVLIERNLRGYARPLTRDLVAPNDFEGGYRCTRHLIELDRHRIGFVECDPISSHEDRLAGYLAALFHANRSGGPHRDPVLLEQASGRPSRESYRSLVDRIVAERLDAVVCYHDYTAIGITLELMVRGLKVPDDVAITGFDGITLGDAFALGITTFAFSAEEVARHAILLAQRRIAEPTGPPVKLLIPGSLVVRESTAGR